MKRLVIALVLASVLFPVAATEARAAVRTKEVEALSIPAVDAATVNVYCTYRSGRRGYSATGTGILLGSRGVVLTNAHVVLPFLMRDSDGESIADCKVRTGSPAKTLYTASLLYIDPDWIEDNLDTITSRTLRGTGEGDFALLYLKDAPAQVQFPGLPVPLLYSSIDEGQEVALAGYPAENLNYKTTAKRLAYKTATAEIVSLYSFAETSVDMITLSGSSLSRSGVSGGPVTRPTGELLGIMTAVEQAKKKDDRRLRAITLPYIDRMITADTGLPLALHLFGNLEARAALTDAALSPETLREITKAQLRVR